MIDEATIKRVAGHEVIHRMGMCTCPCFDALMEVGRRIGEERELMQKLGSVSPIALAAVVGADLAPRSEDESLP